MLLMAVRCETADIACVEELVDEGEGGPVADNGTCARVIIDARVFLEVWRCANHDSSPSSCRLDDNGEFVRVTEQVVSMWLFLPSPFPDGIGTL